jgi:hypothetical protein
MSFIYMFLMASTSFLQVEALFPLSLLFMEKNYTIGRPFIPLEKMGSHNGKPVLRDQDVEALAKSSGLGKDQV